MRLDFVKMHGLGNDFVMVDATVAGFGLSASQVRALSDRRLGVGFDQMLVAEVAESGGADIAMRVLNADGSSAEQCGNGLRCFARFAHDRRVACAARAGRAEAVKRNGNGDGGEGLRIQTVQGLTRARLLAGDQVQVSLPGPDFEPAALPALLPARQSRYALALAEADGGEAFECALVSMGNPHAVLQVGAIEQADVARLGPAVQRCGLFPNSVNVGFMQVVSPEHVRLRVFERGAGETQACGSGACAAVCSGRDQALLARSVRVTLPGGDLDIDWQGPGSEVVMTGPAAYVYSGTIEL